MPRDSKPNLWQRLTEILELEPFDNDSKLNWWLRVSRSEHRLWVYRGGIDVRLSPAIGVLVLIIVIMGALADWRMGD